MGFVVGAVFGVILTVFLLIISSTPIDDYVRKQELFERGHMVQCLGKTGYYWECE